MLPKLLGALPAAAMFDGPLPGASVSRAGSCSDSEGARGRLLSRDGVAGTVTRSECAEGRDKLSGVRATSGGICTAADGFELRGADLCSGSRAGNDDANAGTRLAACHSGHPLRQTSVSAVSAPLLKPARSSGSLPDSRRPSLRSQ
jgi:hypothetical protein